MYRGNPKTKPRRLDGRQLLVFSNLSAHLWEHLQKKEDVLLATILSGNGRSARHSFEEMRESHEKLSQHLDILHRSNFYHLAVRLGLE